MSVFFCVKSHGANNALEDFFLLLEEGDCKNKNNPALHKWNNLYLFLCKNHRLKVFRKYLHTNIKYTCPYKAPANQLQEANIYQRFAYLQSNIHTLFYA